MQPVTPSTTDFWMKPAAKWIVMISAAIVTLGCCCVFMYAANTAFTMYLLRGHMPVGFQAGMDAGAQLGRTNPLYAIASLSLFCVPPFMMLPGALVGYYFLDRYQKRRQTQSAPPSVSS